jgi:hypothetical protein
MRRRRIAGIVLIGSLLSGTYWVRHTGTGDWDDFFNCNEQSNNSSTPMPNMTRLNAPRTAPLRTIDAWRKKGLSIQAAYTWHV